MAFDLTGLPAYVDEQREELIERLVFKGKTLPMLAPLTGVKSATDVHRLNDSVIFADGDSCGFTATGDTTLSRRTLTVGRIKVNKSWCPEELEAKWTQIRLRAGSYYDENDLFAEIATAAINRINSQMETAIWQGDTTSGNQNLLHFDGFLKLISAGSGYTTATGSGSLAINDTNIRTIMQNIYNDIPAELLDYLDDDLVLFAGNDTIRTYQIKLANDNLYHYNGEEQDFDLMVENTRLKATGVPGLNGTDKIVVARKSNMFYGTDLENDYENFDLWYSKDDQVIKMASKWKAGVQFGHLEEVVYFAGA